MTLKEIEYLLAIAQHASISKAARALYVAQPSLTHAIQTVEKEVGFRIFERGRSGVTVTERGEELLSDIRTVYERMAVVQSKYVERQLERLEFSVSVQHFSPAREAIPAFLAGIEEPFYNVKFLEGQITDVIADVAAGRSEIGFLHFPDEKEPVILKELRNEKLEFYGIMRSAPCLLLSREHPLAESAEPLSPQDMAPYPLVSYDYEIYGVPLLQADRRIVVSDSLTMLNLLVHTKACAVGVVFLGNHLLAENGVVTRSLRGVKPLRFGWIKKADTLLQPLAKRYLRMLNPE